MSRAAATRGPEAVGGEDLRALLLSVIDARFPSAVAFEKAAGLPPKTVNNWRRGLSSSYLKQLPALAAVLEIRTADLLPPDTPDGEEAALLSLYRRSAVLPPEERRRFFTEIRVLMNLYLDRYLHRGIGDTKK